MLFNPNRKLLVSRFLKKDEVIRSGESIAFHGYLVDIGEQGNSKPDFSVEQNNCTDVKRREIMHRQDCLDTHITAGNRGQLISIMTWEFAICDQLLNDASVPFSFYFRMHVNITNLLLFAIKSSE